MTPKSKHSWHTPTITTALALIGTACLIALPEQFKGLAFLWWGSSATYALLWMLHGNDRDAGWCDCYFEQVEFQRRLEAKKHPRHRDGRFAEKGGAT